MVDRPRDMSEGDPFNCPLLHCWLTLLEVLAVLPITHAHSALAVAAEASRDSVAITEARRGRIIAVLLGARSLHADTLVRAP